MYDTVYYDKEKEEYFFGNSLSDKLFIKDGALRITNPFEILGAISEDIRIRIDRGETKPNPELIKTYMTLMIQLL